MPQKRLTLNSLLDLGDEHSFSGNSSRKTAVPEKKPVRSLFTFDASDDEEEIHPRSNAKTKSVTTDTKEVLNHELASLKEKVKLLTKSVQTLTDQMQKVTESCTELARSHEVLQEKTMGSVGIVASFIVKLAKKVETTSHSPDIKSYLNDISKGIEKKLPTLRIQVGDGDDVKHLSNLMQVFSLVEDMAKDEVYEDSDNERKDIENEEEVE